MLIYSRYLIGSQRAHQIGQDYRPIKSLTICFSVRQRCGNSSPATYKGIKRTYAELCELGEFFYIFNQSFTIIISAINSTEEKKMMLKDIYNWIQTNVPEFGEGNVLTSLTLTRLNEPHNLWPTSYGP